MGILFLLLVAALACFAGWVAHVIEKWRRNRPPRSLPKKPVFYYQNPPEVVNVAPQASASPRPQIERHPENIKAPLSSRVEPTCIEARFDDWKGTAEDKYPPDWRFRSAAVRQRDGDHCQVAGCPNIGLKHVHHLDSIGNGGNHVLSNLITLCEFHHALMPDHLEAIGQNLEDSRFSVRRKAIRSNPVNPGYHSVRAGIVRRQAASKQEIRMMVQSHEWPCPKCHNHDFECDERQSYAWAQFNSVGKPIDYEWRLVCQHCGCAWYFQGGLLEEIGLILGRVFRQSSNPKLTHYEDLWLEDLEFIEAPACPRSDCLGHRVWRFNRSDGSIFQGCTEWRTHR